jgi:ribosomal protein S18 acetylase RimI-like enzyme
MAAVDDATGKVAGFITAVGDGVLSASIPLLEVLPEYQGRGIGRELVSRMLARLRDVYMVDLICDPDLESFYARFGMQRTHGMSIRNYDRQNGV